MNGLLIIDKPGGLTSHDAVGRTRKALAMRSIGHTGTLDPMATGVLVLVLGEATKLSAYISAEDKEYEAIIALGSSTDTLDADGTVTAEAPVPSELSLQMVQQAADRFLGTHLQQVPSVSAVKVGGRRLYARARAGETFEAPAREVVLHAVDVVAIDADRVSVRLRCGKGFYVRSFARDLAHSLGTVGHLVQLRRLASAGFGVDDAVPFRTIDAAIAGDSAAVHTLHAHVLPLERACASMVRIDLTEAQCVDVRCGRTLETSRCPSGAADVDEGRALALMAPDGKMIAIGRREGDLVRVVRGICAER